MPLIHDPALVAELVASAQEHLQVLREHLEEYQREGNATSLEAAYAASYLAHDDLGLANLINTQPIKEN